MQLLSLVVPCFNEEATIQTFYDEVMKYEDRIDAELEFCFIDDGSTDRTIEILRDLHKKDSRVHYVSFSRNFGKEAGLYAGLSMAKGDYVATMDVDLQDPPALLPDMWRLLHDPIEDYDCVATKRTTRKGEPAIRSFFARQFYKIINKLSKTQIVDGARDFRMMSRQMVNAIVADGEYNRFSKGIFSWVGFKTKWLSYENIESQGDPVDEFANQLSLLGANNALASQQPSAAPEEADVRCAASPVASGGVVALTGVGSQGVVNQPCRTIEAQNAAVLLHVGKPAFLPVGHFFSSEPYSRKILWVPSRNACSSSLISYPSAVSIS